MRRVRGRRSGNGRPAVADQRARWARRPPVLALATVVALVLPLGGVVASGPVASAAVAPWVVQESYPGAVPGGHGLSCASPSVCTIVGSNVFRTADGGADWSTQAPRFTTAEAFTGVSCPTTWDCVAVGGSTIYGGPGAVETTSDTGLTWTARATPAGSYQLQAVSCSSTADCTAVGYQYGGRGGPPQPAIALTTTTGGSSWTAQGIGAAGSVLDGVSCASASTCEAVGIQASGAGLIVGTTNGGATWSPQGVPTGTNALTGVSCPSASTCVAVGAKHLGQATIIATTDGGAAWVRQTVRATATEYLSVSCPSATTCTATGDLATTGGSAPVVVGTTNGGTVWAAQPVPAGTASVDTVSCASTSSCLALGGGAPGNTILATTDGGAHWTAQVPPTEPALRDVSCASAAACTAVGGGAILATTDGGATWAPEAVPAGADAPDFLSCATPTACTAIANTVDGSVIGTTDGGTTWSIRTALGPGVEPTDVSCPTALDCFVTARSPSNQGVVDRTTDGGATWSAETLAGIAPYSLSCSSPADCVAVGSGSGGPAIVATTDAGTTWTAEMPPSGAGNLSDVSCASALDCVAVGTVPIFTTDGGAIWTAGSSPGGGSDVSCPSPGACVAVGGTTILTSADGGATWTGQPAPAVTSALSAVSCSAAAHCTAVGADGSGGLILSNVDTTPPSTAVLVPAPGATLSGGVYLDAGAWDDVGVARVQFELTGGSEHGVVIATAVPTLYGWIAGWQTSGVPDGTYQLQSVATDASGNVGVSAPIGVTVAN